MEFMYVYVIIKHNLSHIKMHANEDQPDARMFHFLNSQNTVRCAPILVLYLHEKEASHHISPKLVIRHLDLGDSRC